MGQACMRDESVPEKLVESDNDVQSKETQNSSNNNAVDSKEEKKSDSKVPYYDYIIIGGGVGGGYALNEFYNLKTDKSSPFYEFLKDKSLLLISNEAYYPYERPILTKDFLSNANKIDLPDFNTCATKHKNAHSKEWYETSGKEANIEVKLNTDATHLDFDNKLVYYQDIPGEMIPDLLKQNSIMWDEKLKITSYEEDSDLKVRYNKLLLATGTHARNFHDLKTPGSDAENIYYIRDYNDAMRVREDIINTYDKVRNENKDERSEMEKEIDGHVVIIGGGYRGQEVCSSILNHDLPELKKITLMFPEAYLMEVSMFKTARETLGEYYTNYFRNTDKVEVICGGYKNHWIKEFITLKDQNIAHKVILNDGTEIKGKHFIVGIGTKSNHKLFKLNDVLKYDRRLKGMPVNAHMETKMQDVYAAGDIVEFFSKFSNSMQKLEQVRHARDSASHAMKSMIAKDGDMLDKIDGYNFFPEFYSEMFNCRWEFYGDCCNDLVNEPDLFNVHIIGDLQNLKEPKLIGIWSMNKDNSVCGMFIETGRSDPTADDKRAFVKKLAKQRENIKIFGKFHPFNQEYNETDSENNDVDAFFAALMK